MTELTLYRGAEAILAEVETDPETGEIGGEFPLDLLVSRNPIGCLAFCLHEKSRAKMIKARIEELTRMQRAAENNAERVKAKLQEAMTLTGTTSIESTDKTFKAKLYRERDASVQIFDENQIPQAYMREIPARYEPDKTLIKRAIEDGYDVPGAAIIKRDRLEVK